LWLFLPGAKVSDFDLIYDSYVAGMTGSILSYPACLSR
jgi:hypothetical protein